MKPIRVWCCYLLIAVAVLESECGCCRCGQPLYPCPRTPYENSQVEAEEQDVSQDTAWPGKNEDAFYDDFTK